MNAKRVSQNETLTWFILADYQSHFVRLDMIYLGSDLSCLRWDLITRDENSGLITLPFVDIHNTTSNDSLVSSYSSVFHTFAASSIKAWLLISASCSSQAPLVIKSAASEQSGNVTATLFYHLVLKWMVKISGHIIIYWSCQIVRTWLNVSWHWPYLYPGLIHFSAAKVCVLRLCETCKEALIDLNTLFYHCKGKCTQSSRWAAVQLTAM